MMRLSLLWLLLPSWSAFAGDVEPVDVEPVVGWVRSGDRCASVTAGGRVLPAAMSACSVRGAGRAVNLESFNFPTEVKNRVSPDDSFKLPVDPPSARRRLGWFPLD